MTRHRKHADFVPRKVVKAASGEIAANGRRYIVSFPRAGGKMTACYYYDFRGHPLKRLLDRYFFNDSNEVAASTINQRFRAVKLLGEFFDQTGEIDLTPEVFKAFCHWMLESDGSKGGQRFSDSSAPSYICNIRMLYRLGLDSGHPGWSQQDLDLISLVGDKILRGCRERSSRASVEKALSLETYVSMVKAVGRELEQCREVLRARNAGERDSLFNLKSKRMAMIDPNPYVVLSLLGAIHHGLRSEELNSLTPEDLRFDEQFGNHEIYVHAPNKTDDFMPVNDTFVEAWRLCGEWAKEARQLAGAAGGELFRECFLVYPPTNSYHSHPLVRLSSYWLNAIHLPYFFKKWFACQITDNHGNSLPLLHAEGDTSRPLAVSYRKLRNAFAVRLAEREKSRAVTTRAFRHKSPRTGERFYLRQARLDHARRVHLALKLESYSLAMSLRNAVAAGVTEETLRRAREAGAVTPHGLCGSALEGGGCERASDCLECPFLVVVTSRKPRFVADRDAYLALAKELNSRGDVRGAENALGRAKVCEAHLIRMEATFGGG